MKPKRNSSAGNALGDRRDHNSIVFRRSRRLRHVGRDQQHPFVQDMVAIDIVRQRERHALGHAAENDRGSRQAQWRIAAHAVDEILNVRSRISSRTVSMTSSPLRHVSMRNAMTKAMSKREPAAVEELGRGRGEEQEVEREQAAVDQCRR